MDLYRKHNGYDIPYVLLCVLLPHSPDAIIIITVIASAMTYSHTPSEQLIVLLSLPLCPTATLSFVYCKIPHLAEMKARLYAR